MQGSIPFAVIGSNSITDVRGKQVRVRQYPWGMAEGILLNGAISTVIKTKYLQQISLFRQKCDKPMLICNKLGKIAKSIVKQSVQLGQQTIFFSVNRRKTPDLRVLVNQSGKNI